MPKVSCIIPVKNGIKTIERAIASAYLCGCDEILVYDDHSTDGTRDLLFDLVDKYPLKSFHDPSDSRIFRGVNFARNWLIDKARYELILPLDCDDELITLKPLMEAYKPHTWVYGDYMQVCEGIKNYYSGAPIGMLYQKNVTQATFLFSRDDWQAVGGYDPDFAFCEDYAFQCALVNAGIEGVYVRGVVHNRYLDPRGNERSTYASAYWSFYRDLARRKYPNVWAGKY